jgi:F-type H+-transporting ATPase subunit b
MNFNPWTFLFEVLNFVVLAAVLYRLLYRPLHEAIDRRREAAARAQAEADKARDQAVTLQQHLQAQLAEVEQQREAALRESRERAEEEGKKMLAETEVEMQHRREQERLALKREREETWRTLRGEMTSLSVDVVQRLLRESCDRSLNDQLALHLIEELRELPAEKRQMIRDQWQPVDGAMLEMAHELDEATLRRITETAGELVGLPLTLATTNVPALLGGVRLRLGGHIWDASLAAQLETPAPVREEENVGCANASNN